MRGRTARKVTLCVLLLGLGSGACFGNFSATRGIYRFNAGVTESRIVQSLLMWGLLIVPVYELVALGDLFIFNVIQFWTGQDILSGSAGADLETAVLETNHAEQVVLRRGDRAYTISRVGQRLRVTANDVVVGSVEIQPSGALKLYDARGDLIGRLSVSEQARATRELARVLPSTPEQVRDAGK